MSVDAKGLEQAGIVPSSKIDDLLRPAPPFVGERVVAIALGEPGEKPDHVATASMVSLRGGRFLVTAKHVIETEAGEPRATTLLVVRRDAAGRLVDQWWARPGRMELGSDDIIWRAPDLDVAILRAPPGLNIPTFDGDLSVDISRKIARGWERYAELDAYVPVCVTGFPSFARELGSTRADYGMVPLPGFIYGFNEARSRFAIHLGCNEIRPNAFDSKLELFQHQLNDPEIEPLGGLSGGPVVAVLENGMFLIGVLSEGRKSFELGYAVPWHTVHDKFSDALALHL